MTSKGISDKCSFGFDFGDLDNGISIYDAVDIFNSDKDNLNDLYIIGIDLANKEFSDYCVDNIYEDIDGTENYNNLDQKEDCSTCYHNCNGKCLAKGIEVKCAEQYLIDCWLYRNSITMRASKDFQDDYNDFYDDFN
jgi:hypothetical protein